MAPGRARRSLNVIAARRWPAFAPRCVCRLDRTESGWDTTVLDVSLVDDLPDGSWEGREDFGDGFRPPREVVCEAPRLRLGRPNLVHLRIAAPVTAISFFPIVAREMWRLGARVRAGARRHRRVRI